MRRPPSEKSSSGATRRACGQSHPAKSRSSATYYHPHLVISRRPHICPSEKTSRRRSCVCRATRVAKTRPERRACGHSHPATFRESRGLRHHINPERRRAPELTNPNTQRRGSQRPAQREGHAGIPTPQRSQGDEGCNTITTQSDGARASPPRISHNPHIPINSVKRRKDPPREKGMRAFPPRKKPRATGLRDQNNPERWRASPPRKQPERRKSRTHRCSRTYPPQISFSEMNSTPTRLIIPSPTITDNLYSRRREKLRV
jgi:hypothetical protein